MIRNFHRHHPASLGSLLVAPVVWSAHFVLCYAMVSLACASAGNDASLPPINAATIGIVLVTVLALGLLLLAAIGNFHRLREASAGDDLGGMDSFLAGTTIALCLLSGLALVWVALPAFMLPTCVS